MNQSFHPSHRGQSSLRQRLGVVAASLLLAQSAWAASTDIANYPLFTSSATAVKPNIMFILDDSGSMAGDSMPDESPSGPSRYGFSAAQCNGLAYNPTITYALPINSDGTSKAAGALSAVKLSSLLTQSSLTSPASASIISSGNTGTLTVSGTNTYPNGTVVTLYDSSNEARWMTGTAASWNSSAKTLQITVSASSGSGTLSSLKLAQGTPVSYFKYNTAVGTQTAMSYIYSGTGVDTTTTFYKECTSFLGNTPGKNVFTKVWVTGASTDAQNYANWAAYYSTRMLMMQTAVGLAFKDIDNKYRVGFTKISDTTVTSASFINVADFDATQRSSFYTALYGATPNSSTPLRGALAKVGRYFAKKASGQTVDPVQYSCQKNFSILSTDGYWNTGDETSSYKSLKLDGLTGVGEQDATAARPMYDGASSKVTTKDTWSVTTPTSDQVVQQPKKTETYIGQTATLTATPFQRTTQKTNAWAATQTGSAVNNSTIARCGSSGCNTITVTSASANGLQVGDSVVIAGVVAGNASNSALYNGTFTVASVISSTQFTYTASARPSNTAPTNAGTTTVPLCHGTQKKVTQTTTAWDDAHINKATTYSLKTDLFTTLTETLIQTVTNYSRTVVAIDGVQSSDTGNVTVSSSSQTTHPALADSNVSTATTGPFASNQALADGTLNTSTSTSDLGCAAAVPADPANTTAAPSTSVAVVTATTATLTSPGTSNVGSSNTVANPLTSPVTSATVTTTTTVVTGGSTDALADIAMYYYLTDLRNGSLNNCTGALGAGTDVCSNNVSGAGRDTASTQHMTTFTLGLGAGGSMKYDSNYLTQTSGDFYQITQGTKNWPTPSTSGGGDPTNIDDLWHTAVNGRGQYFSASDPSSLSSALSTVLDAIKAVSGSAAAAATSTLQPVAGNNQIFLPMFTSVEWTGELRALTVDPSTGAVSTIPTWEAQAQLDATIASATPRKVYYFKKDATANTGTLRSFSYANLTTDALNANFDNFCNKTGLATAKPKQCSTLVAADLTTANSGSNLVSYLVGNKYAGVYRDRQHVLGDIVNASPIYLGAPPFQYTENGYASFASGKAGREGVVYAAANDGMLHAFAGKTGVEKWAYIPSMVLPNLYKLADTAYKDNHQAYVDGSPNVADIYDGTAWKSILVAGLGAGGRGYYALDITDPDNPKALWEFTDTDLGLTFGNPIVTKLRDGTWVVVFASGYNNNVGGNGNGYLYVLNANTGALMKNGAGVSLKIATYTSGTTPAGTVATPSGLAKLNAWVDSPIDNTAKRFYGGDLLGNLWRFDVDGLVAPNVAALRLAQLQVSGTPQPITTKPELAEITANGGTRAVVFVATGEYLGTSDLSTTATQSIYGIQDRLSTTGLGDARAGGTLVAQTLTQTLNSSSQAIRTVSSNAVDWAVKNGWMLDLPTPGERVNVDMLLQFNTLVVASNVPNNDACNAGGESWVFQLGLGTGSNISSAPDKAAAVWQAAMTVGLGFVQLKSGSESASSTGVIIRNDNQGNIGTSGLNQEGASLGTVRRTSWRELAN